MFCIDSAAILSVIFCDSATIQDHGSTVTNGAATGLIRISVIADTASILNECDLIVNGAPPIGSVATEVS